MMPFVISAVLLLLLNWLLIRGTQGVWQKLMILSAAPVGALLGLYGSSGICYLILRLFGRGESHDDMISIAGFGMLGLIVGGIGLPLLFWLFIKKRNKDHTAT